MTLPEHEALAGWLHGRERWVLSYDDHPEVRRLYASGKITEIAATYSAGPGENKRRTELLIEA
jgi:hypothetical protein